MVYSPKKFNAYDTEFGSIRTHYVKEFEDTTTLSAGEM